MITGKQLVEEYKKSIGKFTYEERDCITSIWEILKKYGAKTELIGSNWFARHELRNTRPLIDKSQLYDGCAVLKSKLPGEGGYALPDRYKNDADPIDYNHIGIGTDAGEIYDSTRYKNSAGGYTRNGPGLSTAKIGPNSWDVIADFVDVDYTGKAPEKEGDPMENQNDNPYTVYINLPASETVKYRINPNKNSPWWGLIPGGTAVQAYGGEPGWTRVFHNGHDGYVMSTFITEKAPAESIPFEDSLTGEQRAMLEQARDLIDKLLGA